MIFGSKTGYGKVDLILQPSHLQFCKETDVKAPSKNRSTSEPSLTSLRAIEPDRRPEKPGASVKVPGLSRKTEEELVFVFGRNGDRHRGKV